MGRGDAGHFAADAGGFLDWADCFAAKKKLPWSGTGTGTGSGFIKPCIPSSDPTATDNGILAVADRKRNAKENYAECSGLTFIHTLFYYCRKEKKRKERKRKARLACAACLGRCLYQQPVAWLADSRRTASPLPMC